MSNQPPNQSKEASAATGNLENWKEWVDPIAKIFQTLALVIGGFWVLFQYLDYQGKQNDLSTRKLELDVNQNELDIDQKTSLFTNIEAQPTMSVELLSNDYDQNGRLEYLVIWEVEVENVGTQTISVDSHLVRMYHGTFEKDSQDKTSVFEINHPVLEEEGDVDWEPAISKEYLIDGITNQYLTLDTDKEILDKIAVGDLRPGDNLFGGASMIVRAKPGEIVFGLSYIRGYKNGEESEDGWFYEFSYEVLQDLEQE